MWWTVAVSVALTFGVQDTSPCDSVLRLEPGAYVDSTAVMVEQDGQAMQWAACQHERSMARLKGNAGLAGLVEALHERMIKAHEAVGELVWLQCQCNGYGHLETRDRAPFERDFAGLVDLYASDRARECSPELRRRVEYLQGRILARLREPSIWDLGQLMIAQSLDSTEARSEWDSTARPCIEAVNGHVRLPRSGMNGDRAVVAMLEVVDGEVQRLLGGPEKERRSVEREREVARRRRSGEK